MGQLNDKGKSNSPIKEMYPKGRKSYDYNNDPHMQRSVVDTVRQEMQQ